MTYLSKRYEDALVYANTIHAAQVRKGTGIPYVSHLLAVSSITLEHGGDEDQAIAALLHDAVEDCGGEGRLKDIRARFGGDVAAIVDHCTDSWVEPKPDWKERKLAYLSSLALKPVRSLLVSMADKTHNAGAIVADLHVIGDELWSRFTASKDETLWYYRSLADAFSARADDRGARELSAMLGRRVGEMHELAGKRFEPRLT